MIKTMTWMSAIALAALSACSDADLPANEVATENHSNATIADSNSQSPPPARTEPKITSPATADGQAPRRSSPVKPAPSPPPPPPPPKPKPAPPPLDPHAGHDMNNMQ